MRLPRPQEHQLSSPGTDVWGRHLLQHPWCSKPPLHVGEGVQLLTTSPVRLQVLAKSCKMVPVMLMGTLVGGKRYSVLEYACALLIGVGVSLFAARNSGKVTQKLAAPDARLGYALCLANLLLDGYTNAAQVRLQKGVEGPQPVLRLALQQEPQANRNPPALQPAIC